MDLSHWLAGGAVLGLVTACWTKIKTVCWRAISLFVQQVEVQDELTQGAVVDHMVRTRKRSRAYDRIYGACNEHTTDGKFGMIPYEVLGRRSLVFWNGWFPILYAPGQKPAQSGNNNQNPAGQEKTSCTLTFVRGTLDVEHLIRDACDERNESSWDVALTHKERVRRFFIKHVPALGNSSNATGNQGTAALAWYQQHRFRLLRHAPHQLGKHNPGRSSPLEDLIFPTPVKGLIEEIRLWRSSKEWYQERGIPWKRGWLCFGPPGTGKTALARAFAEELDMPLFVYNLAEMSNSELMKAWSEMQAAAPCVALIEDIDNVFHGREYVARSRFSMFMSPRKGKASRDDGDDDDDERGSGSGGLLSFDCLLNCLDGVERSEGVFTIITTNDVSKVDPALGQPRHLPDGSVEFISTRPGRIDKAVELTYMEPGDKRRMAQRILGEYEDEYLKMLAFVERFPDLQETPAQFQERCAQVALACFWAEQEEDTASDSWTDQEPGEDVCLAATHQGSR
jgi:ATPase family associated with various cellular activities (AAA)